MSKRVVPFPVNHTGSVVGGASAQPCSVTVHGWAINNTAASAASVTFYAPAGTVDGTTPAVPSTAAPVAFVVEIAANSSKEFLDPVGVWFENGLFAVSSATTCTGSLFIS